VRLVLLPRLRLVPDGGQAPHRPVREDQQVDAPLRAVPGGGAGRREGRLSPVAPSETPATDLDPLPTGSPEGKGPGLDRLGRRLLVPLGLGVLVVVGLALTANPRELARS